MGLLASILIGLIVGAIAKALMPGKDAGGIIVTILLGIAGAFVAGLIGRLLGWYEPQQPAGLIASVLGAMILLYIYRVATKNSVRHTPLPR
jgi:uncharacterized membrane protein YeaQ/YmgE (transglycosylase-associated protein family)